MGKIGIMGGTFDPIHLAHLEMAKCALKQKELDCVWFMPSKIPPHKRKQKISDEQMRSTMICMAIENEPGFFFSDFELKREEITYTARTLELLQQKYPSEEFYFILGGDSLFQFENWYHPEEVAKRATILAVGRGGVSLERLQERATFLSHKYNGRFEIVRMSQMDISSSEIRRKIVAGESVEDYLPDKVYQYIKENRCYQGA